MSFQTSAENSQERATDVMWIMWRGTVVCFRRGHAAEWRVQLG